MWKVGDIITDGKLKFKITNIIDDHFYSILLTEYINLFTKIKYPIGSNWHYMASIQEYKKILGYKKVNTLKSHLPIWW